MIDQALAALPIVAALARLVQDDTHNLEIDATLEEQREQDGDATKTSRRINLSLSYAPTGWSTRATIADGPLGSIVSDALAGEALALVQVSQTLLGQIIVEASTAALKMPDLHVLLESLMGMRQLVMLDPSVLTYTADVVVSKFNEASVLRLFNCTYLNLSVHPAPTAQSAPKRGIPVTLVALDKLTGASAWITENPELFNGPARTIEQRANDLLTSLLLCCAWSVELMPTQPTQSIVGIAKGITGILRHMRDEFRPIEEAVLTWGMTYHTNAMRLGLMKACMFGIRPRTKPEWRMVPFETLRGLTFESVRVVGEDEILTTFQRGDDVVLFEGERTFAIMHKIDCCEDVILEDCNGDLANLVGTPIFSAAEAVSESQPGEVEESLTWSFYHLRTSKGDVTLRFRGASNGYYSETVQLYERILEDATLPREV